MSPQPVPTTPRVQEPREVQFAPLDNELTFHVTATIAGVTGVLEIRAQRVSTIARTINLLKQNGLLVEQPAVQPASPNVEPPVCPEHGRKMKKSKFKGWFCPHQDDGTGEYCQQKVN